MISRHKSILSLSAGIALAACGPSTPEAKVQERAAIDFNCSPAEITAKPLDAPTLRRFEASGCGREAVYVNAAPAGGGDNWVLDSPNRAE
ncbi:MAG: hypothetical protein HUU21_32985 [Polyangiaceae bacterium]|nr:hypothetical protein [Polyangiaceae bacterium]NUQ78371.1 hypothetical protein [Polyangiaceae bacterium]